MGILTYASNLEPDIAQWYLNRETGELFEVVAFDDQATNVQIQYFDGEIETIDTDLWQQMNLVTIPEPEDWSGPYELSKEDNYFSDEPFHPQDWSGPLLDMESLDSIIILDEW